MPTPPAHTVVHFEIPADDVDRRGAAEWGPDE